MRTRDVEEVTQVLETYIRGTREGDADLLRSVFDPEAMVAGWFGDIRRVGRPDGFIGRAASTPCGPDYRACVSSVEVRGRMAEGTVLEDGLWDGFSFVNRFHLLRGEDGRWVITAKLYHRD